MYKLLLCSVFFTNSSVYSQTCNPSISRTAPDSRYQLVVGSGGSEVLDTQTKLIWQRCSLGQTWSGTNCTGTASTHTWIDALTKAKAVGNGYRLPNTKELQSLVEEACYNSSINETLFPETPSNWYWSSSPFANTIGDAWVVFFGDGDSHSYSRITYKNYVRAVRAGQ